MQDYEAVCVLLLLAYYHGTINTETQGGAVQLWLLHFSSDEGGKGERAELWIQQRDLPACFFNLDTHHQ